MLAALGEALDELSARVESAAADTWAEVQLAHSDENALLRLLKSVAGIDSLIDRVFHTYTGARQVTTSALCQWLVWRAKAVGGAAATKNLSDFIASHRARVRVYSVLLGAEILSETALASDLTLIPFRALPPSPGRDTAIRMAKGPGGMLIRDNTACMVLNISMRKILTAMSPTSDSHQAHVDSLVRTEAERIDKVLNEAANFLALYGGCLAAIGVQWTVASDGVPSGGFTASTRGGAAYKASPPVWPCDLSNMAVDGSMPILFEKYRRLSEASRRDLQIPLNRLARSSHSQFYLDDSAIDLGIGIESFFLRGQEQDRNELSFRIALHAARFLGQSIEERREIYRDVKNVYSRRSTVAHSGSVSRGDAYKELPKGRAVLTRAIKRVVEDGHWPDWQVVELG